MRSSSYRIWQCISRKSALGSVEAGESCTLNNIQIVLKSAQAGPKNVIACLLMVMMLLPTILLEFSLGALAPPSHIAKDPFYFSSTTSIPLSTASANRTCILGDLTSVKQAKLGLIVVVRMSRILKMSRVTCFECHVRRPTTRRFFFHDHGQRCIARNRGHPAKSCIPVK